MNIVSVSIVSVRFLIIIVLSFVGLVVQHRSFCNREKSSAYECGLDPNMSARIPFSLRFFLLAVIFLVFDVEIALLIGVPYKIRVRRAERFIGVVRFLGVLVVGLLHEWREGSLN